MRFPFLSIYLALLFAIASSLASAQTIAAGRTIRSKSIITAADLIILAKSTPGTYSDAKQITGMEARTVLYPGRAIRPSDIGPPTVVTRNEIVVLSYQSGSLRISTEGRALARGGIGERIRVMNLSSRTTITGIIVGPGQIKVTQ